MRKAVWLSRDLMFHSCGPACCDQRPKGMYEVRKGTECYLVKPTTAERLRVEFLRGQGRKCFVVEVNGKRRFLDRDDLQSTAQHEESQRKSRIKLTRLSRLSRLSRKAK